MRDRRETEGAAGGVWVALLVVAAACAVGWVIGCDTSDVMPGPLAVPKQKLLDHVPAIETQAKAIQKDPSVERDPERAGIILDHTAQLSTAAEDMDAAEDAYARERAMWKSQLDAAQAETAKALAELETAQQDANQQASTLLLWLAGLCFAIGAAGVAAGIFLKLRAGYAIAAVGGGLGALFLGLQQALWWLRWVPLVFAAAAVGYLAWELFVRKRSMRQIIDGVQDVIDNHPTMAAEIKQVLDAKQVSTTTKKQVAEEKVAIKTEKAAAEMTAVGQPGSNGEAKA